MKLITCYFARMKRAKQVWHFVRWPLLVLALAYAALVIYRIPAVGEAQRTKVAVAAIQAQKITMADVLGTNLPPVPYEPENDATVAGIDKNNNGIRDDVERAIFAKYPNDAKIRAAELQYALDQQILVTEVFNSQTWIAAAEQNSNEFRGQLEDQSRTFMPRTEYEAGHKELSDQLDNLQAKVEKLEALKQGGNTTLYVIIGVVGAMIGLITFARNILIPKKNETR